MLIKEKNDAKLRYFKSGRSAKGHKVTGTVICDDGQTRWHYVPS